MGRRILGWEERKLLAAERAAAAAERSAVALEHLASLADGERVRRERAEGDGGRFTRWPYVEGTGVGPGV